MKREVQQLTPRNPLLDVERTSVLWARNHEVALIWNAMSVGAPTVESYLNQIMVKARKKIGASDPQLYREIENFVGQESNHLRMHIRYNSRLAECGYDGFVPLEADLKQQYKKIMEKSFSFNLAYCTGFENFTLYTARFMFESARDLFEGTSEAAADVWIWHMAEEFEHRSLCHDVFSKLSGNYFIRIYGLVYSFVHLNKFINSVTRSFLAKYREGMSPSEIKQSRKREKAYHRRYMLFAFPRMLKILLPYYDPGKAKMPADIRRALDHYQAITAPSDGGSKFAPAV